MSYGENSSWTFTNRCINRDANTKNMVARSTCVNMYVLRSLSSLSMKQISLKRGNGHIVTYLIDFCYGKCATALFQLIMTSSLVEVHQKWRDGPANRIMS